MLSPAQSEVERFDPHRYNEIVAIANGDEELVEWRCQELVNQWEADMLDQWEADTFDQDDPWSYP